MATFVEPAPSAIPRPIREPTISLQDPDGRPDHSHPPLQASKTRLLARPKVCHANLLIAFANVLACHVGVRFGLANRRPEATHAAMDAGTAAAPGRWLAQTHSNLRGVVKCHTERL